MADEIDYLLDASWYTENAIGVDDEDDPNLYEGVEFRRDVQDIAEIKQILGRQWEHNLIKIYKLFKRFYKLAKNEEGKYVELCISTTSQREINVVGSQRNVSNAIERAEKIDLLHCTNDSYSFGDFVHPENNSSKLYILNTEVFEIIREWYNTEVAYDDLYDDVPYSEERLRECISQGLNLSHSWKDVRFNSNLMLKTDMDWEELNDALYYNYPMLIELKMLIHEQNRNPFIASREELKRTANPSITMYGKSTTIIRKLGIRDTSKLSGVKNRKEPLRDKYLDGVFGPGWLHYDVPSSIYRVLHLLNFGEWVDDSIDFYELINGSPFKDKESRDKFKTICMRFMFTQSPERIVANIQRSITKKADSDTKKGNTPELYPTKLSKSERANCVNMASQWIKNLEKSCGPRISSEIFLHESRIYAEFSVWLMNTLGLDVVQVYDSFYVRPFQQQSEFEQLCRKSLREIAERYYQKYFSKP